jgi:hypothetical protein
MTRINRINKEDLYFSINQIELENPYYKKLTLFSKDKDFLGEIRFNLSKNEKLIIVNQVYARTGFGQEVYDHLSMYADTLNNTITCTRSGDVRTSAHNHYVRMFNDDKYLKIPLSEEYHSDFEEFTCIEDNPEMYTGYSLKANNEFKNKLKNINSIENNIIYKEVIGKLNKAFIETTPFLAAYENGNDVFDIHLPLKIESSFLELKKSKNKSSHIKP